MDDLGQVEVEGGCLCQSTLLSNYLESFLICCKPSTTHSSTLTTRLLAIHLLCTRFVAKKGLCPRSCACRSASQRVLSALFRPRCTPSRFLSKFRAILFRPSRHAPNIEPLTRVKSNPNDVLRLALPCFLHSQPFAARYWWGIPLKVQRVHSSQQGLMISPTHMSLLIILLLAGWPLRHVSALRCISTGFRGASTHRSFAPAFAAPPGSALAAKVGRLPSRSDERH